MPAELTEPCGPCPFKRKSARGWLGSMTPAQFLNRSGPGEYECHNATNYDDPHWNDDPEALVLCRGAHDYDANVDEVWDYPEVFATRAEFIAHHDVPANRDMAAATRFLHNLKMELAEAREELRRAEPKRRRLALLRVVHLQSRLDQILGDNDG